MKKGRKRFKSQVTKKKKNMPNRIDRTEEETKRGYERKKTGGRIERIRTKEKRIDIKKT